MKTKVILYYKYVKVQDPEGEKIAHRAICERLGLKGRILIGAEGINGTAAGAPDAVDEYISYLDNHPLFDGIDFKIDYSEKVPFPKLRIKTRDEIVTLGVPADPTKGARRLTPDEFEAMIQNPNVVLFDARNNYESKIGKFKGAITPDISLFKDLPRALEQYEDLKEKTVITYCTGGIRCEKASALLIDNGFNDVYQLDGGIITYGQKYPEGAFEGECFVFDSRMSVAFKENPELLGDCYLCQSPTNSYTNCANKECNRLMLRCEACHRQEFCSSDCEALLQRA